MSFYNISVSLLTFNARLLVQFKTYDVDDVDAALVETEEVVL